MFIHIQIAFGMDSEIDHSMSSDLFQHVIKEPNTCRNITLTRPVQIQSYIDIRLFRCPFHFGYSLSGEKKFCYFVPRHPFFA